MKYFKCGIALIICMLFVSCTRDETVTPSITSTGSNNQSLKKLPAPQPLIVSSVFWQNNHANNITEFYQYGWRAIGLNAEWDLWPGVQENWHAAKNLYSIKYAQIWIDFAQEGSSKNIPEIKRQIDSVSAHNGTWIYFDDFLTSYVHNNNDPTKRITKATIDEICDYAHSKTPRLDVAVSEDMATVYYWGQIENDWSLYEKIDIVMPYGYVDNYRGESMYNHLYNFYNYLKNTKSKRVVPILGWNTGLGQNQRGSRSGDTGFIERALQFADQSRVFYYYEVNQPNNVDLSTFADLTIYLRQYNYIVGNGLPPY